MGEARRLQGEQREDDGVSYVRVKQLQSRGARGEIIIGVVVVEGSPAVVVDGWRLEWMKLYAR